MRWTINPPQQLAAYPSQDRGVLIPLTDIGILKICLALVACRKVSSPKDIEIVQVILSQLDALPFYLWREAGQFCTRVSADEEDWAGSTSRNF
jgi:hypothetical protein